jgi:hypothetical protein
VDGDGVLRSGRRRLVEEWTGTALRVTETMLRRTATAC